MLRLRQKVRRDNPCVSGVVRDDEHLGRACQHVDRHATGDERLGGSDEHVARAHHRVARFDGSSAIRERGDRMRPADGKKAVSACNIGGCESRGRRVRRGDHNARAACSSRCDHCRCRTVLGSG